MVRPIKSESRSGGEPNLRAALELPQDPLLEKGIEEAMILFRTRDEFQIE